jgi:hypothetical protein
MNNRMIFAIAGAALAVGGLAGCGGSGHTAAAKSAPAATAAVPLAVATPQPGKAGNTCTTISYKLTAQGVEITAKVAAPATITFEADDSDDNSVGESAPLKQSFTSGHLSATLLIKGVKTLDHVSALPLGTSTDDSCWAYAG